MHNPLREATDDDSQGVKLVLQANCGDRDSLERLILRHQAWIYNIAIRMVFDPQDAEEVTQEVLIIRLFKCERAATEDHRASERGE